MPQCVQSGSVCHGYAIKQIFGYRYSLVNGLDPYLFEKRILIEISLPRYRYKKNWLYLFNKDTDTYEYRYHRYFNCARTNTGTDPLGCHGGPLATTTDPEVVCAAPPN